MGIEPTVDGVLPNTIHREGREVLITLPWRDAWDRVASMRKFAEIEYSAVNTVMLVPGVEAVTVHRKKGVPDTISFLYRFSDEGRATKFNDRWDPDQSA